MSRLLDEMLDEMLNDFDVSKLETLVGADELRVRRREFSNGVVFECAIIGTKAGRMFGTTGMARTAQEALRIALEEWQR